MLSYLIRRLILAGFTLLFITFLIYALIRNMPGTPISNETTDPSFKMSPERFKKLEKLYGLDKPIPLGYLVWAGNTFIKRDLGFSIQEKCKVSEAIGKRLGPTLLLSGGSLILAYFASIPFGLYSSARSGKIDERGLSVGLYALFSLPSYVSGLMLLSLCASYLTDTWAELPLQGMVSPDYATRPFFGKSLDILKHLFLPLLCLTYGQLAYDSRFIKANMEEAVRQDYIRTARAKGASAWRILIVHAFRNTMIPFVTMLGLSLPSIVGGAVILESIFNWPGMGQLFYVSIQRRDYELIMGLTLMFTFLTLTGQLLADMLYAFVDPRITYK